MSYQFQRILAARALLPLTMLLAPSLRGLSTNVFAAQAPLTCECLELHAVASTGTLDGSVTNRCGKSITAYTIDAEVLYSDGTKSMNRGAREEFMPALAHVKDLPSAYGIGPIRPGETRPLYPRSLPPSQKDGVTTTGSVGSISAVIFDDGSALGDESLIGEIFQERLLAAKKATFWRATLLGMKDKLMTAGKLRDCLDSPEVKVRIEGADRTTQGSVIRSHYANMERLAQFFDSQPQRFSRSEAVDYILTFAEDSESSSALHSRRRQGRIR